MDKNEMIDKVSNLYRENIKNINKNKEEIQEIREKMKNPSIMYSKYIELENRLKLLESYHSYLMYTGKGIGMAREALLY